MCFQVSFSLCSLLFGTNAFVSTYQKTCKICQQNLLLLHRILIDTLGIYLYFFKFHLFIPVENIILITCKRIWNSVLRCTYAVEYQLLVYSLEGAIIASFLKEVFYRTLSVFKNIPKTWSFHEKLLNTWHANLHKQVENPEHSFGITFDKNTEIAFEPGNERTCQKM